MDEYLFPQGGNTVPSLLKKYADKPWMSHGMIVGGCEVCNDVRGEEMWAIERTTFMWPGVFCTQRERFEDVNFCADWNQHRKYFLNPLKVSTDFIIGT